MKFSIEPKKTPKTESLIVPLFKDDLKLPGFLSATDKKLFERLWKAKEFKAEKGECLIDLSAGTVIKLAWLGLGEKDQLNYDGWYRALGATILKLKRAKTREVSVDLPKPLFEKLSALEVGQAVAESCLISGYSFQKYKTKDKTDQIKQVVLRPEILDKNLAKGLRVGQIIAESVNFSRDLGNSPSNEMTPLIIADQALQIGKEYPSIKVKILDKKAIGAEKMGGLLGVNKGSAQEPRFIIMEYFGASDLKKKPTVVVGKGITFDTGGISIKPSQNLEEMKFDMAGGAAVLAMIRTAAALKLPINLVGLVPSTENMPGGNAYKPGDILRIADGSTVEVINTDAEGRLILADALVYARRYSPELVIDLATLTGACVVALGDFAAGLFTKDEGLRQKLLHSATHTGDHVWPMPIYDEYNERLKSSVADIRNLSTSTGGGSITAALFLQHFVKGYRWAHIDIAGTAWAVGGNSFMEPGATGAGVRLLTQFFRENL